LESIHPLNNGDSGTNSRTKVISLCPKKSINLIENPRVAGSIPAKATNKNPAKTRGFLVFIGIDVDVVFGLYCPQLSPIIPQIPERIPEHLGVRGGKKTRVARPQNAVVVGWVCCGDGFGS
jgi:hypothetical protein